MMGMKVMLDESVLADNNRAAAFNRSLFDRTNTLVINMMSSPGSGKTTILERTIEALAPEFRIGVIEGDLATQKDADRIRALGAEAVQINTHGGCHLDARMIAKVLLDLSLDDLDLLFIENVGNLICPSGYDLGQHHKVVVLSVTEGNDKIAKYPVMFRRTELVLLNKIDLLPHVEFDLEEAAADLRGIQPASRLLPLSAKTGEGMEAWLNWIRERMSHD